MWTVNIKHVNLNFALYVTITIITTIKHYSKMEYETETVILMQFTFCIKIK